VHDQGNRSLNWINPPIFFWTPRRGWGTFVKISLKKCHTHKLQVSTNPLFWPTKIISHFTLHKWKTMPLRVSKGNKKIMLARAKMASQSGLDIL
jgi:hypothetical protein